jgi:hypothetical protein
MSNLYNGTIDPYYLLVLPCQFTVGKTGRLLELIKISTLNSINLHEDKSNEINNCNNETCDKHTIDIIVTNLSLQETEQWKTRANKKFEHLSDFRIDILSSKSKDFKKIDDYINILYDAESKKDLPNILIVCFHKKRCDDIIKLCNRFCRKYRRVFLPNIERDTEITFNISLDEPDANISITKKYIKHTKEYIDKGSINRITFITATPIKKFWNMLNKNEINQLLNMEKLFNKNNIIDYDSEKKNYREFCEHNIKEHNNDTNNPLKYIIDLYSNKIIDNNDNMKKIIFAPGHSYTKKENVGSHIEIANFFRAIEYVVFIFNGQFKGFKYPDGTEIELNQYQEKFKIGKGELRDTLRHWNENNPNYNLAITGYNCIERGVTFNTDGFNFTHCIISKYHLSCIGRLIQLVGRTNGSKEFVDIMTIITTSEIIETIKNNTKKIDEICSLNPDYFNKTDFNNNKSNTIPVKLIFNNINLLEHLIKIKENDKSNRKYKSQFHKLLSEGIDKKEISVYDKNNINKFDISSRTLKTVRLYKNGDKIESRRYKNFSDAHNNCDSISQKGDNTNYNIDLVKDKYINGDFINYPNTAWITYRT